MVGEGGLEPPHPHRYRILRPTRLPFRHSPKLVRPLIKDDLAIIPLNKTVSQDLWLNLVWLFLDKPRLRVIFHIVLSAVLLESLHSAA